MVAVVSSVITLTSLSIERLLIVMFPMKGRLSRNMLTFLVVFSWVAALGTSAPNLKVRKKLEIQWRNRKDVWCDEIWPRFYTDTKCNSDQPGRKSYYVFLSIFMYFIPIVIMVVAYGLIGFKLFRRRIPGNGINDVNCVHGNARRKVKFVSTSNENFIKQILTVYDMKTFTFMLKWEKRLRFETKSTSVGLTCFSVIAASL